MASLLSARHQAMTIALLLVGCGDPGPTPEADEVTRNNRAIGLMGQYEYAKAATIWENLLVDRPNWVDGKVNLALAILNRQDQGDEARALSILQSASEEHPTNLRAQYLSGILLLRAGRAEDAAMRFKFVLNIDPTDAYIWYHYGSALEAWGQPSALRTYEKAVELDPYLRSAWYRLGQVSARQGDTERSEVALAQFERLETNPRAVMIKPVYGRLGPKALAATLDQPALEPPLPEGPLWADAPVRLGEPVDSIDAPSVADLNGDGERDIFFGGHVFLSSDNGIVPDPDHPLAQVEGVRFALFGDLDNDGGLDAYLARNGANVVLSRDGDTWHDTTSERHLSGGDFLTLDGILVDIDHDGDLDVILANSNGPTQLFANTLNGAFKDISVETGFAEATDATQLVVADLDDSNDLDVLVLRTTGANILFRNDRLWSFTAEPAYQGLVRAIAADLDGTGSTKVFGVRPDYTLVENDTVLRTLDDIPVNLAAFDVDGDGTLELVTDDDLPIENVRSWTPAVLNTPEEGYSIVAIQDYGTPVVLSPGDGRYAFAPITLAGSDDPSQQMRSNANGIGTLLAARRGSTWTIQRNLPNHSGPGQGLEPMLVGLGGAPDLDFVLIDWPDGLVQTELGAAAQGRIVETQRQASSCPVLFAFDGESMAFVSDLLGVGGIGFLLSPGVYGEPRPHERFWLPRGALGLDEQGFLSLVLCEPMEEACYLDHVALTGWLLPASWSVAIDERMAITGPQPTGDALFYSTSLKPTRAFTSRGDDVTPSILGADLVAAPVGELDPRFIGRLASEHVLSFTFDVSLDTLDDPWLIMDGWIEYPYSQTMFASWQAGATYDAPSLDALGGDGAWHVVQEQFGYPAGMPRQAAFPLRNLPKGTTALRLRTNQEIYWDCLRVIDRKPAPAGARSFKAPLQTATLEAIGYPKRIEQPQRRPDYDFADRSPLLDFRHMRGLYTEFGNVVDLIGTSDQRIAIFGPGEGITIEFALPDGVVASDVTWLLDVTGWCKDRDRFTATGATLQPLPADAPRANRIEAGY